MRHPDDEAGVPAGAGGAHPDEGTIHAWLDDALPAAEAEALERHVGACATCAAAVAEARGLLAATTRILGALDAVPGGVLPDAAPARKEPGVASLPTAGTTAARPRRRAWRGWPVQAAAVALLAVGTWTVLERRNPGASDAVVAAGAAESVADAGAAGAAASAAATAPVGPVGPERIALEDSTAAASRTPRGALSAPAPRLPSAPPAVDQPLRAIAEVPPTVSRPADAAGFAASGAARQRKAMLDSSVADRAASAMRRSSAEQFEVAAAPPPPPPPAMASAIADASTRPATVVVGRVTTLMGEPVRDALVTVVGKPAATRTGTDGRFALVAPAGAGDSVAVQRIGFERGVAALTTSPDDTMTVLLRPSNMLLSDVVVTGMASVPDAVGCYRPEVGSAASSTAWVAGAAERALGGPLRLTDESAGGGWRWVRSGLRDDAGATVARWRELADDAVEVEWPQRDGLRLRLRAGDELLAGEGRVRGETATVAVTLRPVACEPGGGR